jgi:Fe-S-cluster containining protein
MNNLQKVGRNSPCPCGSGNKYKHCCGDFYQTGVTFYRGEKSLALDEPDRIALHKAIAYQGKVGRMRAEFCLQYIARKQTVFKQMEKDLLAKTSAHGEAITCREGCAYCCSQYITGTLHEAEAIVYFLYQHPVLLDKFTLACKAWKEKINKNQDIFEKLQEYFGKLIIDGKTEANHRLYQEANTKYMAQNTPCPFLAEGSCSIYEVRPYCCASIVATTPSEYCRLAITDKPSVYVSYLRPKELPFFRHTNDLVFVNIPQTVYELLNGGYGWMKGIPGLERLEDEVNNDPEVKAILQTYG